MSDNEEWYLDRDPAPNLHSWVFRHMAMGAVYAGLVLFGIIAILVILRAISHALPEDPFAALDLGLRVADAIV